MSSLQWWIIIETFSHTQFIFTHAVVFLSIVKHLLRTNSLQSWYFMMHTWFSCTFLVSLGKKKQKLLLYWWFPLLEWYEAEMPTTHQDVTVKRQKADASSFNHKKCLILNLSFDLITIWPKALDAMGLTEEQVIWGSQEDIPFKWAFSATHCSSFFPF